MPFARSAREDRARRSSAFATIPALGFVGISQKVVNVLDPGPGENSLAADAAVLLLQVGEQFHLQIVPGCEVGVSSFAGKRMMPEAIPVKTRHPQSSFGGDDGAVAFSPFRTLAQGDEVF